jgi:hypothetical protein
MICIREKVPTGGICEQVVRGLRVANHFPLGIKRVPPHSREGPMLAKPTSVYRHWRPDGCSTTPICIHDRGEMIAHRVRIGEVNRRAAADRQEGVKQSSVTASGSWSLYLRAYS